MAWGLWGDLIKDKSSGSWYVDDGSEGGGVSTSSMDPCCDYLFMAGYGSKYVFVCVSVRVCVLISHGPHDRGIRGSVAFPSCAFHTVTTHTIHKTPWLHPPQRHKGSRREMGQIVSAEHVCLICGLWHIPFNWHSCFFSVLVWSCFLLGERRTGLWKQLTWSVDRNGPPEMAGIGELNLSSGVVMCNRKTRKHLSNLISSILFVLTAIFTIFLINFVQLPVRMINRITNK